MPDSTLSIPHLKRLVTKPLRISGAGLFALGDDAIDARLSGGLARGGLHEIVAQTAGDSPTALGFALMLGARATAAGDAILIITTDRHARTEGQIYAPGLIELGIDPAQLLIVRTGDEMSALRAAADGLAASGLGAVIIDVGEAKRLDLTASRRLLLAAERAGVAGIVLRPPDSRFASAASTRWSIAAAPSETLPGTAPGQTRMSIALLRHRGGVPPFETLLEWDRDRQSFCTPNLLRDLPATVERRPMAA